METAKFSMLKRKSVAVLLTVSIVASLFVTMFSSLSPLTASAATLATIGNHSIGSDDFTTDKLATDWVKVNSAADASVSGGKLILKNAGTASSFNAMLLRKEKATNQRVRLDFTATKYINPEVWARVQTDTSGNVTGGYFVRFISGANNGGKKAALYKAYTDTTGYHTELLAELGTMELNSSNTGRIEIVVTGTNPTTVTAIIYKNASIAHTNVIVDKTAQLQVKGVAGLTYQKDGNTAAASAVDKFEAIAFEYSSTDNETGEYYTQGAKGAWHKANEVCRFAQILVLDPNKQYVVEAIASKTNTKNLFVEYANSEGKAVSFFDDDETPTVSVSEDGYHLVQYVINGFPNTAERNNNFKQYTSGTAVAGTRVRVGYKRGSSDEMNNAVADFTRFRVYEKNDPKKTNLLVNGDFKMGFYNWTLTPFGNINDFQYFSNAGASQFAVEGETVLKGDRGYVNVFDTTAKAAFKSNMNINDVGKLTYLNNTYYQLTQQNKLNIAYIGGSVTNGYGSSDTSTKSWAALTTAWFEEKFPNAEISSSNAAIGGTGSYLGLFRYEKDVQTTSPDLVFIEFAINDFYDETTKAQSIRNLESMIQYAYTRNQNIDIILVATMDKWRLHDYDNYLAMKEVADKYGLMFINIKDEFQAFLAANGTQYETYFGVNDGVHPNDTGYGVYAQIVTDNLASDIILNDPQTVSLKRKSAPSTNLSATDLMLDTSLIKADEIAFDGNSGFTYEKRTFSTLGNRGYSSRYISSTPGSTLTFKFVGTDLGLLYAGKADGGQISCVVDNGTPIVIDTYRAAANPKTAVIAENLANAEHTVTFTVLDTKNAASSGTSIEIGAILLNGTLPINPNNEYMVHNMGTSANAQFGQIVDLAPNTEYQYSLYYKNISGNSTPAVWYIKDGGTAYQKLADDAYTSIVKSELTDNGTHYDATYTFKVPSDAKLDGGVAKILVGYDSGALGSDTYYYGFKLVESGSDNNLLVNTNFKRGLFGWSSVGYNYVPDSTDTASVTLNRDARLVKFESLDFFKLALVDGDVMLHITGQSNYSHITQFIDLDKTKTYRFSLRKKFIKENSSKPYVWFKLNGKTGKSDWSAQNLTATEENKDSMYFVYEFTIPENATVSENGFVNAKIGVSTGSTGADIYYADFKLWAVDDLQQTNLFKNPDFKQGFKNWRIGGNGGEVLCETLGVTTVSGAELLAYDETVFINDTSDNMFNDGDWSAQFGPDETFEDFIKRIYKLVGRQLPNSFENGLLGSDGTTSSPQTGDNSTAGVAVASGILILSLLSLAFVYPKIKKSRKG